MSGELACPCCGPDEELLDALAELLLDPVELTEYAADVLMQHAGEVYG